MYKGEKINSISHLVGASLSLAALVLLVIKGVESGDSYKLTSAIIYGIGQFLMFLFSTLYHSFKGTPKAVFQRFDHIGIFLLIAGTYTPFTLVLMRETSGTMILSVVWGLAAFGITFKAVFGPRYNLVSTLFYLLCGWAIALDIPGLRASLSGPAMNWLIAGGLVYSLGAIFYLKDSLPRNHEIWHFFVMGAAMCHFAGIYFYVL